MHKNVTILTIQFSHLKSIYIVVQSSPRSIPRIFLSSHTVALVFILSSLGLFPIWLPGPTLWKHVMETLPKARNIVGQALRVLLKISYFYHFLSPLIILCNPPKEGLLEVGMGYNPFTGAEIEVQEISRLIWRVRTQGQAFAVQVCAFSMTSQRCDQSAELYADLFIFSLTFSVSDYEKEEKNPHIGTCSWTLAGQDRPTRNLAAGFVYQFQSLTHGKSSNNLT